MVQHDSYEHISEKDFWKLTICPDCGALLLQYATMENKSMLVNVLEDFTFQRWGNHYNFVFSHECGERNSEIKQNMYVQIIEPNQEVREKVKNPVQQQAVMKCLTKFNGARIRSNFKKAMLKQAQDFLAGKIEYKNPFSPKQAVCILGDSITTSTKQRIARRLEKKNSVTLEYKEHVVCFKDGSILRVFDKEKKVEFVVKLKDCNKMVTLHTWDYWDSKKTLVEMLEDPENAFTIETRENTIAYTEV